MFNYRCHRLPHLVTVPQSMRREENSLKWCNSKMSLRQRNSSSKIIFRSHRFQERLKLFHKRESHILSGIIVSFNHMFSITERLPEYTNIWIAPEHKLSQFHALKYEECNSLEPSTSQGRTSFCVATFLLPSMASYLVASSKFLRCRDWPQFQEINEKQNWPTYKSILKDKSTREKHCAHFFILDLKYYHAK